MCILRLLYRSEPKGCHRGPQDLREGVGDTHILVVPPRSIHEQAVGVSTPIWMTRRHEVQLLHLKVPDDPVDCNFVLPRVILQDSREECLLKEVCREPEHERDVVLNPILDELPSQQEVLDVRQKRLQRWVRHAHPRIGDPVGKASIGYRLQLRGKHDQPLHRLSEVDARRLDLFKQPAELAELHVEHRVQALVVAHGIRAQHGTLICHVWHLARNLSGDLAVLLFRRLLLPAFLVVVGGCGSTERTHH
mmetsp:Transcript_3523/g.8471  ORF Transcript_3523/g.8471 Transcript_3523/m.8471 type:complete len:249 (+) Transcript_3523:360-1106(+)